MTTLPAEGTLLVLSSPMGVPLYSARGLTQTLKPIPQAADLRRDINGNLVDLSVAGFRKYASSIQCKDVEAPALDGIWPGQILTVSCVAELSYLTAGGAAQRTAVSGSSYVSGAFTYYRPQLTMRVMSFQSSDAEWPNEVSWMLELEEI